MYLENHLILITELSVIGQDNIAQSWTFHINHKTWTEQ